MLKGLFFIVFIINIHTSSCALEALYETARKVWKLYAIIDNRESDISHSADAAEPLNDTVKKEEMEKQVDEIHERLAELEQFMGPKKIRDAIKSWSLSAPTIREIDTIELFVRNIDGYYEKFIQQRNENYHSYASFEAIKNDLFLNLEGNIEIIRKFATNQDKSLSNESGFVAAIAVFTVVHGAEICGIPQVISNLLFQLFRIMIIAELKTSTMLAYENIYEYVTNKDKYWEKMNSLAKEKFEKQFAIYMNMYSLHIAAIDDVYNRACDPVGGNWIRDKSFYELERTFQALVFTYDWNNCQKDSCNNVRIGNAGRCPPSFYVEPVATGPENTVEECSPMRSIEACILKEKSDLYKFHYVNSTKLGFFGRNTPCPEDNGQVVESRLTLVSIHAVCTCNFYSSHNKISLLMIESDVESSRVITGLRFLRRNNVLYIQLREGTLESNGYIKRSSDIWKPIPEYYDVWMTEPINRENRVFFLDDLILPAGHVLTGVKFDKVTRESVSGFAIRIYGTHFDYKTGTLFFEEDHRPSWRELNQKAGTGLLYDPVSSLLTKLPHTVTPSSTTYVSLNQSRLEEDFGQSTLPLFDAVPITFDVPSPLGGVGIFHKGVVGYAGFISLRVYGINYKEYFDDFEVFHIINDRVSFNSSFQ